MSDFLSKFSGNNYDDLLAEDKKGKNKPLDHAQLVSKAPFDSSSEKAAKGRLKGADANVSDTKALPLTKISEEKQERIDQFFTQEEKAELASFRRQEKAPANRRREESHEETEIDPDYQKKKKRKIILIASSALAALLVILFLFYQLTHVTVPNFVGKTITEARDWGNKNGVEILLSQEYSITYDANLILSQKVKEGKKVSKGSKLALVGSLGADPKELLPLPDFASMSYSDAQSWIEENKAENLKITQAYSDTTAKGKFIKLEIANAIPASDYTRGDKATLTYSRGQEVLEANIEVPDFAGKNKSDVESWAKTNSIEVTYEEKASATLAAGFILGQSVAANEKVAKKSKFTVQVSAGKGITVPDFSTLTMTQASSVTGLSVIVRQVYGNAPYGALLSQSKEAGTELTEKDDKNIEVVYSAGSPYIRDLTGKNEGELQQYFYDEFRSKGAEIYFTSYYVDSDQPKGTLVAQSAKETWLPLSYTVEVGISNGRYFTATVISSSHTDTSSDTSSAQTGLGATP